MAASSILIIDPDATLGELMARILAEDGYRTQAIRSIAEIEEAFKDNEFDLIITEAFDQKDQFDFDPGYLEKIRAVAGDTPIILCSTYPSTDILHVGDFGLAGVIAKPFSIDELQQTVKQALRCPESNCLEQNDPA